MNENYRIITGPDTSALGRKINEAIVAGYTVAGGVSVHQQAGGVLFIQALIKKGM